MPKKYKQKSLLTKPTSSAPPNLSLSSSSSIPDVPLTKSVNDLIHESRRDSGHERSSTVSSASSMPPALREVLSMPAPLPPIPRHAIRGPTRLRRIPGPPPPRSWLLDSDHAPPEARSIPWSQTHERARIKQHFSTLPEGSFPNAGSLQDVVMRSMASNWAWHAEYDHEYLAVLPTKVKQNLLSYIATYSDGQGTNPLRILFPSCLDQGELDEVRRLDMGNAIGGWSTLRKIERELDGDQTFPTVGVMPVVHEKGYVPDSWDNDEPLDQPSLTRTLVNSGTRFRNLKHISLAVAPETKRSVTSWSGLLGLTGKLPTITSLSLAYWPQPTFTPIASSAMVKIRSPTAGSLPPVTYGGTNFYSAFDNDWREAAAILRTLSRSLYCLKWLDLTGCGDWFSALTWQSSDDEENIAAIGPDWNGSWRQLEDLNLSVGWKPEPTPSKPPPPHIEQPVSWTEVRECEISRASSSLCRISASRLGPVDNGPATQPETWNAEHERDKYYHRLDMARYTEIVDRAKKVAKEVRASRKEHGGKWINVEISQRDIL